MNIVDWDKELSYASTDEKVGISIAMLVQSNKKGTYITTILPGSSVNPHYHKKGDEEYHIISGSGVIRLLPAESAQKKFQPVCKQVKSHNSFIIPPNVIHQLINNGQEPLILIFTCPLSHLKDDRIVIENIEERLSRETELKHQYTDCD